MTSEDILDMTARVSLTRASTAEVASSPRQEIMTAESKSGVKKSKKNKKKMRITSSKVAPEGNVDLLLAAAENQKNATKTSATYSPMIKEKATTSPRKHTSYAK
jgi:hypothetical protein